VARLVERDYLAVLDVLSEVAAVDGPIPFTQPVLEALRRLVPSDVVAYHEGVGPGRLVVWDGEPRGVVTRPPREAQRRYAEEDPLVPAPGARKYSDYLSARQLRRLGLYREVAQPLGVEDMFRLWLEPDGENGARLEFDRPARDFCERDRAVLDVLWPHLRRFRRKALHRKSFDGGGVLTLREREILALVAQGWTNSEVARSLWVARGTVRKHLDNIYAKLGVHTRTAAVAAVRRAESP
jgi:DNA-binding CsgD family transcriptional regulator